MMISSTGDFLWGALFGVVIALVSFGSFVWKASRPKP